MRKLLSLITFAAGTTFGLLFATKKGKDVRDRISKGKDADEKLSIMGKEATEFGKSLANMLKPQLKKAKLKLEKEVSRLKKAAGKEMEVVKNVGKKQIKNMKSKASKGIKKAKSALKKK